MARKTRVVRAEDAKPKTGEQIDSRLLKDFAIWIKDEHRRRKNNRRWLEEKWEEVDQQVAMVYDQRVAENGVPAEDTDWIPELDVPLQAQGVEVLVTDARNLLFSDGGTWFKTHAALTDMYLKRWDDKSAIVGGEDVGIPSRLTQDGADKVTRAALTYVHRAYDFKTRWDICNAEAFKYGTFAMRSVLARIDLQADNNFGAKSGVLMPVAVPVSIRNLFLDDSTMFATHEGHVLRPGHIRMFWQKFVDLQLAAKLGGADKGWVLENVELVKPVQETSKEQDPARTNQDRDSVMLLEWEGDLTHVSGETSVYAPNMIITVAVGSVNSAVVRVRENPLPFDSYTIGHYQRDDPTSPYGVGPLMKGVPVQKAATAALNDYLQASELRARPPVSYSPNDPWLAKLGGPKMEPGAQWPAISAPEVHEIGNPQELLTGFEALVKQHENFTGVNQVRLGAQTKSHQSAFAVQQEGIRGQIRTVDYVRSLTEGAMLSYLNKEFVLTKMALKGERRMIWVDDYKGHIEIDADHLPDQVTIEVIGASGPEEQAQENQLFLATAKGLLEMEPMSRQLGGKPINVDKLRTEALRRINVEDVSSYFSAAPAPAAAPAVAAAAGAPGLPAGAAPGPALPGAAPVAPQTAPRAVVPIRR